MASLHALLPEPAKPAHSPTRQPAQPFFAPAHRPAAPATPFFAPAGRPTAAPPFFPPKPAPKPAAPAPKPAAPAPALLAAVPEVLAPAVALLAHAARQQAPYQLLAHALGHDPLTGNAVPAAPLALARTLVGLLPDGPARFQQLQAAGPALAQLPAWLHHQLAAHQLTGPRLTQVLTQTGTQLRALGLRDALDPAAALARLAQPWLALGQDVARFVGRAEAALLRWLLTAVLGPDHAAPVLKALDQGGDLLLRILRHPLPFLTNLVAAGQRGFAAFLAHGPRHLLAAVQDWLLGGLAQAGLHLPAKLDVAGLLDVLLQVFDLTKAAVLHRLRQRLPALPTERLQAVLTQVGGVALTLWQHGPQAAWLAISQQAEGLRAQALDFVQQQVLGVAAKAVPLFLASLAVPGGAFLQLARGLYNGVMLFVEKGRQLAQVGQALFASASAIAAGQLAPAALAVENTLVKILPVALNFLGRLLRLDAIPQAIQTGLKKVRVPVEKAVNKVLDTVAEKANAIWGALKTGAGKALNKGKEVATAVGTTVAGWLGLRKPFTNPEGEQHTLFLQPADKGARLMVASTPQALERYLQAARVAATAGQLRLINQAEALRLQLSAYTVDVDGPAVAQRVEGLLTKISALLAQIGGQTLATLPLPTSAGFTASGGATRSAEVAHVSSQTAYVGGNIKANSPQGWPLLQAAGLTAGSRWVKMHMISDKLGGQPEDANLLPAPGPINSGPVLNFETRAKNLLTTPKPVPPGALPLNHADKKPTVLWLTAQTTGFYPASATPLYDNQTFATGIKLQAGLVFYNGLSKLWERDNTVVLRANVAIPQPNWIGGRRALPSINFMSRAALIKLTGCSPKFADLVKQTIKYPTTGANIPYRSETDFETRMQIHAGAPNFQANLDKVLDALGATGNPAKITLSTTI